MSYQTGGCMCGTVRYSATLRGDHSVCYCGMCQRWASGSFAGVPTSAFSITDGADAVQVYRSSEWAERAFCRVCGSNLYYRALQNDCPSVSLGTLDDTGGVKLARQFFVDRRPEGLALADTTGAMTEAETIALFTGGADG